MDTHHLNAQATVTLPRPHPLNPLRRLLRLRVPTYQTHLIADAVVHAADKPDLSLTTTEDGRYALVVFTWPGRVGGTTARVTVRERGNGYMIAKERHDFPVIAAEAAAANAPEGLAGSVAMATAPARSRDPEPVDFALPGRVAAMFAEGALPSPLPGDCPPPTQDTTVLHDLRFIMDQLELAQFQVAMSPGGSDAGSVDNAAYLALRATQLVQAKLEVVADAADLAAAEVMGAVARLNESADRHGPAQQCLNRSRAMLRQVCNRLPLQPESARVTF